MKLNNSLLQTDGEAGLPGDESPASPKPTLNLNDLSAFQIKVSPEAEVPYREGLSFKLTYLSKPDLQRMMKGCVKMEHNPRTKQREPRIDNDDFMDKFCRRCVKGWTGATLRVISAIAMLDKSKITTEDLDKPVPFNHENLLFLLKNSYDVDEFLQNSATDVKVFNPNWEDEVKN